MNKGLAWRGEAGWRTVSYTSFLMMCCLRSSLISCFRLPMSVNTSPSRRHSLCSFSSCSRICDGGGACVRCTGPH